MVIGILRGAKIGLNFDQVYIGAGTCVAFLIITPVLFLCALLGDPPSRLVSTEKPGLYYPNVLRVNLLPCNQLVELITRN